MPKSIKMTWERTADLSEPWQPVKRVPKSVLRRHAKRVTRGDTDLVIPAARYYYRLISAC